MKKRILYILGTLMSFIILSFVLTHKTVDKTPYQEMPYYQQSINYLDSLNVLRVSKRSLNDSLRVGWAKTSLILNQNVPLAGYGAREGALAKGVRDSVWVRAVVLDNGRKKFAMLSADLLIIPVQVTRKLEKALLSIGLSLDRTYMGATHTHCSLGAWDPSFVGELFAGTFDTTVVNHITNAIVQAISEASKNLKPAQVGFGQIAAPNFVYNRLVGDKGIEDPYLRMLKFKRSDNRSAVWLTYAAHATCFSDKQMYFSQDYPGELVKLLENQKNVDFAVYAAGAVGSHGPEGNKLADDAQVDFMAKGLYQKVTEVLDSIPMKTPQNIDMIRTRLYLREPHLRLNSNIRSRPWVFKKIIGDFPAYLTALRIGETILLGTSCDFSGELVPEINTLGNNIMVTSFNGGYVGYITKDEWYELDSYETRTMNWFGPYNGAYFVEMMSRMVEVLGDD